VTGTLAGGSFEAGDEVELVGAGAIGRVRRGRIRGIQSHMKQVPRIGPGNRTALNIVGLERAAVARGDAVVRPGLVAATGRIDAMLHVLGESVAGHAYELTEKGAHLLYAGSAETPVVIKLLEHQPVGSGSSTVAQLYLHDALPLQRGDLFVLRDAGRVLTFGGGRVLDPLPAPARRADSSHITLLRALDGADETGAVAAIVTAAGQIDATSALKRAGTETIPSGVRSLGSLLVSEGRHGELIEHVHTALEEFHGDSPLEPGMPRELLRSSLDLDPPSFDALLNDLGDVVASAAVVRLRSHEIALSPEQEEARSRLMQALDAASFTPPPAKELGADPALISSLVQTGELVRVGDFYLSAAKAREARSKVRSGIEKSGPLTVADIRDLLGTSRKYAVPLCEWLDQTGATLRRGDTRILGPNP
jgi:selenocysteine-specific elongation factor